MRTHTAPRRFARRLAAILAVCVATAAARLPAQGAAPAVIFLVLHGEKDMVSKENPPLSEAGQARAAALADALGQAGVTAIVTTQR